MHWLLSQGFTLAFSYGFCTENFLPQYKDLTAQIKSCNSGHSGDVNSMDSMQFAAVIKKKKKLRCIVVFFDVPDNIKYLNS